MSEREIDKSYFVSFCIEQYKRRTSLSGSDVAALLFSSGVADYLSNNFDVLHAQSSQWLMEEVEERLKEAQSI